MISLTLGSLTLPRKSSAAVISRVTSPSSSRLCHRINNISRPPTNASRVTSPSSSRLHHRINNISRTFLANASRVTSPSSNRLHHRINNISRTFLANAVVGKLAHYLFFRPNVCQITASSFRPFHSNSAQSLKALPNKICVAHTVLYRKQQIDSEISWVRKEAAATFNVDEIKPSSVDEI